MSRKVKRVNKWKVIWRVLIIVSMLLNANQLHQRFMKLPGVKRFVVLAMIDRAIDKTIGR